MSLATQLISGSVQVLNLVKNYLDNPRISMDAQGGSYGYPVPDPETLVVLRCESFQEVGPSDISSQLIVSEGVIDSKTGTVGSSGKNWITDNIAPKPRNWELKGYIGYNYGSTLSSVATTIGQQLAGPLFQDQLQKSKQLLRNMRLSRQMLVFQTPNGEEVVWVGMKNLQITNDPIVLNQIPISMSLQEVPILEYANGTIVGSGQPTNGYAANPVSQGLSTALQVSNFAGVLALAGV